MPIRLRNTRSYQLVQQGGGVVRLMSLASPNDRKDRQSVDASCFWLLILLAIVGVSSRFQLGDLPRIARQGFVLWPMELGGIAGEFRPIWL